LENYNAKEVIDRLRSELCAVDVTHAGLRSFADMPVMTHAFFPGGNGLYEGLEAKLFPYGGTLILGSNFGCVEKFIDANGVPLENDERDNPTWRSLLKRLRGANIKREKCFFTNAWPFLHEGSSNLNTVIKTWLCDQILMSSCAKFFEYAYAITKPRLIIALGKGPAAFLSYIWPEELGPWRKYPVQNLNDLPMASVCLQEQRAICVAITHPSMAHNAKRRRPPYSGEDGEIQLLIEARLEGERISNE